MVLSVLLPVYIKENPAFLKEALLSIFNQTHRPCEIVVVKDGPLTKELDSVLEWSKGQCPQLLRVVALEENKGLGVALDVGVRACEGVYIARMDSDDVARPERLKTQLGFLQENPEIDLLGSWVEEFQESKEAVLGVRRVPESHAEILSYAKKRNPLNHPAVMFRKQAVLDVGGYLPFPYNEDYYLWVRMLVAGKRAHNIQESLLWFRVSRSTYARRGGLRYLVQDWNLQREFHRLGLVTTRERIRNCLLRGGVRLLPNALREKLYRGYLRDTKQT